MLPQVGTWLRRLCGGADASLCRAPSSRSTRETRSTKLGVQNLEERCTPSSVPFTAGAVDVRTAIVRQHDSDIDHNTQPSNRTFDRALADVVHSTHFADGIYVGCEAPCADHLDRVFADRGGLDRLGAVDRAFDALDDGDLNGLWCVPVDRHHHTAPPSQTPCPTGNQPRGTLTQEDGTITYTDGEGDDTITINGSTVRIVGTDANGCRVDETHFGDPHVTDNTTGTTTTWEGNVRTVDLGDVSITMTAGTANSPVLSTVVTDRNDGTTLTVDNTANQITNFASGGGTSTICPPATRQHRGTLTNENDTITYTDGEGDDTVSINGSTVRIVGTDANGCRVDETHFGDPHVTDNTTGTTTTWEGNVRTVDLGDVSITMTAGTANSPVLSTVVTDRNDGTILTVDNTANQITNFVSGGGDSTYCPPVTRQPCDRGDRGDRHDRGDDGRDHQPVCTNPGNGHQPPPPVCNPGDGHQPPPPVCDPGDGNTPVTTPPQTVTPPPPSSGLVLSPGQQRKLNFNTTGNQFVDGNGGLVQNSINQIATGFYIPSNPAAPPITLPLSPGMAKKMGLFSI